MANKVAVKFKQGTFEVLNSYYEFARRYPKQNGRLYQGFIASSADKIFELYRCRWQIELVFKRLKSLFELSKIPSAKPETAQAWFYGKFF